MGKPLTLRTQQLIEMIDDAIVRAKIIELFDSEGALYGSPTVEVSERVRFSVIKMAMQGLEMYEVAAELFRVDTRDLLVMARFADDVTAHERWCEEMLNAKDL